MDLEVLNAIEDTIFDQFDKMDEKVGVAVGKFKWRPINELPMSRKGYFHYGHWIECLSRGWKWHVGVAYRPCEAHSATHFYIPDLPEPPEKPEKSMFS